MFPPSAIDRTETRPPGRRDRKKLQIRAQLVESAVHLFAVAGYDATTIEQITEAVDVSPRTFFRYFSSKEDVLFPVADHEPFLARVRTQPLEVGHVEAVRDAYLAMLPMSHATKVRTLLFKRALASTPALQGRNLMLQRDFRDQIALALAQRHGWLVPDDSTILAASIAQTVMQLAFDQWAAADGREDVAEILRSHFALVRNVLPPSEPSVQL